MNDRRSARALNVVALATYPVEAAGSRYRIVQFVEPLAALGVRMRFLPFLSSSAFGTLYDRKRILRTAGSLVAGTMRRVLQLPAIARADALFVQREAMLIGPPFVEWIAAMAKCPIVLDLDDATWMEQPRSVYGRIATLLKWPGKTDRLIGLASSVICGNATIAEYVTRAGKRAVVAATIVDTARFAPAARTQAEVPVIGWVGTHSTFAYFEWIIPVLERLASEFRFRVRVVGSGRDAVAIRGLEVETRPWSLDREVEDFATLDIGVYPLFAGRWEEGKSAFKAVQYLCAGVPFVASPVGAVTATGVAGETHLLAGSPEAWHDALAALLRDPQRRRAMGEAGRAYALEHYSVERHAELIAGELRLAAGRTVSGTRAAADAV